MLSGPSATCSDENIGLSRRNDPWQAMWTSSARDSSPVHAATVASSPTSTTGSTYPPARCLTSTSAKSRPGPATNPASMPSRSVPRRWRNVRSACPHELTEAFTDTDRPASGGSKPHGTSWRIAVGTMTTGSNDSATIGGSTISASSSANAYSISAAASLDSSEPWMRLSRCSENVTASIRSLTSSSGPRSCSRARPAITETACSRPSSRAWASSWRSPRSPSADLISRCRLIRADASPRAARARRRTSRSTRAWVSSASRLSSSGTDGSAIVASMLRNSASSRASSGSAGGRSDGVRAAISRVASILARSSRGRPSAIAIRAPISVRALPWIAAWARVSIDPRPAWFDIATARPRLIARRAAGRSPRRCAATRRRGRAGCDPPRGPLRIRRRSFEGDEPRPNRRPPRLAGERASSSRRVASAPNPSTRALDHFVELVGETRIAERPCGRPPAGQGASRRPSNPPAPACDTTSPQPRPRSCAPSRSPLANRSRRHGQQAVGHLDLVALLLEHRERLGQQRLGIVEQRCVSERQGVLGVDLREIAHRPGRDRSLLGALELARSPLAGRRIASPVNPRFCAARWQRGRADRSRRR